MYAWITATKPLAKSSLTLRVVAKNHYSSPSVLRKLGFKIIMMDDGDFGQKNKKIMMTAHAQPQEMLPDKTLRSGRRRSKSEKPQAAPESPQNRRRKPIVVNTHLDGYSVSRISLGKKRNFG